ncbi:MAG TPA: HAD-IA family hydrolase [Thermoanaerobaculia bacterium]|nr:HAD-IA family hydrolase [Thermoanaerobaculia bacterium]
MPHKAQRSVSGLPAGGIKAIFFDAGATLIHPDPPVEEVYAREFSEGRIRFSPQELSGALTRAWEEVHAEKMADRYGGVRGEPGFWKTFLNRVRGRLDGGTVSPEVFARLSAHFADPSSWVIYEDVTETLESLERMGFLLAVVSNWDSQLPRLLERLGLSAHFRAVSVSAIERIGKPDPEIFRRTCARLGVSATEALHVGDSLIEDYEGARGAGLSAFLLDRPGRLDRRPDCIRSLAEIPARLSVL